MTFNPLQFKKDITSFPLKTMWEHFNPADVVPDHDNPDRDFDTNEFAVLALYAGAAAFTLSANLGLPFKLINMGMRGDRYFSHLSYVKNAIGFPMPLFNYITPGSPAEKFGAKLGGRIGAGFMSHVPPFSWYDPTMKIASHTKASWRGAGAKVGAKVGGRVVGRLVPGLGWGLLAYDVYDIAVNRSLWGFDLD